MAKKKAKKKAKKATDWDKYQGVRPCPKAWKAAGIICERMTLLGHRKIDGGIGDEPLYVKRVQLISDKILKSLKTGFAQMIQVEVYGSKRPEPKKKK